MANSGTTTSDLSASSISTQAMEQGAKHTPGPWAYEFVPDNDIERQEGRNSWSGLYIGREDDERPGQVFRTIIEGAVVHGPNEGDPEADARLIAAAPDMLAALQEAEGFFRSLRINRDRETAAAYALDAVRAAIAKATGAS